MFHYDPFLNLQWSKTTSAYIFDPLLMRFAEMLFHLSCLSGTYYCQLKWLNALTDTVMDDFKADMVCS